MQTNRSIVHAGTAYDQPIITRYQWIDEVTEDGKIQYLIFVFNDYSYALDLYNFGTAEERAQYTEESCAMTHRTTCWPDWAGPLPPYLG